MIHRSRLANGMSISGFVLAACLTSAPSPETPHGSEYVSPNQLFSVVVPRAPNWAGVPYTVTALDTKDDEQYDKVLFHADDFGQFLVAGVKVVSAISVSEMDKDEPRTVLRNLSQAVLMGWRTDFREVPQVVREASVETTHGEALERVYHATKGSILTEAQGRVPTRADAFDTNIAAIVTRHGDTVIYVLAEDDARPNDADSIARIAVDLFESLQVPTRR